MSDLFRGKTVGELTEFGVQVVHVGIRAKQLENLGCPIQIAAIQCHAHCNMIRILW